MSEFRDAMNVSEVARLITMSRSRFTQLIGTVFPVPKRDEHGRPYYTRDDQQLIVEIRKRNTGMDGKPILFRATGKRTSAPPRLKKSVGKPTEDYAELLNAVRSLGLTQATKKELADCVRELFPDGKLPDKGDLIRRVFLSLKSRYSRDAQ
jgi:hypothetical protein